MGKDKALIPYHGKPQFQYTYELLSSKLDTVFISCRQAQQQHFEQYNLLFDVQQNIGPMAGLLAAFEYNPHCAWLVLGCDYPNFDLQALEQLLMHRNPAKLATAYYNAEMDWAEPMLAIWEPAARAQLNDAVKDKRLSLRRLLSASDVELVQPQHSLVIKSIDSPGDVGS